jgi:hypothetical protein
MDVRPKVFRPKVSLTMAESYHRKVDMDQPLT